MDSIHLYTDAAIGKYGGGAGIVIWSEQSFMRAMSVPAPVRMGQRNAELYAILLGLEAIFINPYPCNLQVTAFTDSKAAAWAILNPEKVDDPVARAIIVRILEHTGSRVKYRVIPSHTEDSADGDECHRVRIRQAHKLAGRARTLCKELFKR